MNTIQTAFVSGFRHNYHTVLDQVTEGPVLLLENSQVAAVLVSPEETKIGREGAGSACGG